MSDLAALTPEALYLNISHKLTTPDEYTSTEIAHDFGHLMNALRVSIGQISQLTALVKSANTLLEEQEIEIFTKDCEIFNFTSQNDAKDDNARK